MLYQDDKDGGPVEQELIWPLDEAKPNHKRVQEPVSSENNEPAEYDDHKAEGQRKNNRDQAPSSLMGWQPRQRITNRKPDQQAYEGRHETKAKCFGQNVEIISVGQEFRIVHKAEARTSKRLVARVEARPQKAEHRDNKKYQQEYRCRREK